MSSRFPVLALVTARWSACDDRLTCVILAKRLHPTHPPSRTSPLAAVLSSIRSKADRLRNGDFPTKTGLRICHPVSSVNCLSVHQRPPLPPMLIVLFNAFYRCTLRFSRLTAPLNVTRHVCVQHLWGPSCADYRKLFTKQRPAIVVLASKLESFRNKERKSKGNSDRVMDKEGWVLALARLELESKLWQSYVSWEVTQGHSLSDKQGPSLGN
ncbi:hypothetical protein J6590_054480 [Homalodisca vitripennis]|nr:hypothetical protein J6590_054480 [Homalodisca vitripennis]